MKEFIEILKGSAIGVMYMLTPIMLIGICEKISEEPFSIEKAGVFCILGILGHLKADIISLKEGRGEKV